MYIFSTEMYFRKWCSETKTQKREMKKLFIESVIDKSFFKVSFKKSSTEIIYFWPQGWPAWCKYSKTPSLSLTLQK